MRLWLTRQQKCRAYRIPGIRQWRLDGDGKADVIEYVLDSSDSSNPPIVSSFTINDTEYKELLYDDFLLALDFPWTDGFYIVDIDTSDELLEIAILDEGPSSDQSTFYFRYSEGELTYVGDIPDYPGSKTCIFNGDGTVTAQLRLSVLQTWWAPATWRLNEFDRLQQEAQTAFVPYEVWNKSALLEDLPLFLTKDQSSDTTVAPTGSNITFVETDNLHWIKLKTDGGVTGWFYLNDYSTVMVERRAERDHRNIQRFTICRLGLIDRNNRDLRHMVQVFFMQKTIAK